MVNTLKALKEFFSTTDKPVSNTEMVTFWKSLDENEQEYFKTADLT